MLPIFETDAAQRNVEWLSQQLFDISVPSTTRHRLAIACLAIAQDHHHSIVLLMQERRHASAIALLRPALESFLRGEWLAHCATDSQVETFLKDGEPPRLSALLADLESVPAYSTGDLAKLVRQHWSAMCSFTHSGGLHAQRWITESSIEPDYSVPELRASLRLGELIGNLSGVATAVLASNEDLAIKILTRIRMSQDAA